MRTRDSALRKNNPFYGPECFTYLPESNSYRCPAGEQLNYVGLNVRNRAHAYVIPKERRRELFGIRRSEDLVFQENERRGPRLGTGGHLAPHQVQLRRVDQYARMMERRGRGAARGRVRGRGRAHLRQGDRARHEQRARDDGGQEDAFAT